MTGVTAEGYDDGVDYSGDYIGNLSDPNLKACADADCDLDGTGHYHCDDETATWWIDHCKIAEGNADRISRMPESVRLEFDAWAETEGVYNLDVDDSVRAVAAHLEES
jgi:hypothetical protein